MVSRTFTKGYRITRHARGGGLVALEVDTFDFCAVRYDPATGLHEEFDNKRPCGSPIMVGLLDLSSDEQLDQGEELRHDDRSFVITAHVLELELDDWLFDLLDPMFRQGLDDHDHDHDEASIRQSIAEGAARVARMIRVARTAEEARQRLEREENAAELRRNARVATNQPSAETSPPGADASSEATPGTTPA